MKIFKFIVMTIIMLNLINIIEIENRLLVPIMISTTSRTEKVLSLFGIKNNRVQKTIDFAAEQYNISPDFIIALISTESGFDEDAVSPKNYKGLMQIPNSVPSDANILIGSRIFREKMSITNNDAIKAICLYKGYKVGTARGLQQANKVISLYHKIRRIEI